MARECSECGTTIGDSGKTGMCRKCAGRATQERKAQAQAAVSQVPPHITREIEEPTTDAPVYVKERPRRPVGGHITDKTHTNLQPGDHGRWVTKRDKTAEVRARQLGYVPVRVEDQEGAQRVAPMMGHMAPDHTVEGGNDSILMVADKSQVESRKRVQAAKNVARVKANVKEYARQQVAIGALTEEEAQQLHKTGVQVGEQTRIEAETTEEA